MDPGHCSSARVDLPRPPFSIAGPADAARLGRLKGNAGRVLQPESGSAVQNPWLFGAGGLKRKRGNGELLSPSPSKGGLRAGSQYLRCAEDECFSADLRLGPTARNPKGMAEDGCFTSLASAGRSGLTSAHSGGHVYEASSHVMGKQQKFVFGSKGRTVLDMGLADSAMPAPGMQLQLGLSDSSSLTADSDFMSSVPLGRGQNGAYQAAMKEAPSCHESIPVVGQSGIYEEAMKEAHFLGDGIPIVDEGSTSSRFNKAGGYIPSLLMGRRPECLPSYRTDREEEGNSESMFVDRIDCTGEPNNRLLSYESGPQNSVLMSLSATTSASVPSSEGWERERAPKICKFRGCNKGARGASGLCIIHGGGRRCQRQGCSKSAEGSTVYCKSHGGGRRCQSLGCTKSAEGKTDYCIAHGGGRRCSFDACMKAARGRSGLCIRHGGGKRCQKEGCTKSAEGFSGLCISHGGGRRCQYEGCKKGAQGSTMFCKAHGGGKRCMIQGCNKGAEGSTPLCKGHGGGKRCLFEGGGICTKSVHGGTSFCVAHGGGKRCAVKECTKSARGRTDFCVRHGGGKRCKVENCTKSAQGSTDFCKAHGGGKRCSWGQEGSPYSEFMKEKMGELFKGPCERFARGKLGLCAAHAALVQDRRVHGVGMVGNTLSSGIGPGLFRGIVEGSRLTGDHSSPGHEMDLLYIHAGSRSIDVHGECTTSKLPILPCRSSKDSTVVGRDYGVTELPSGSLGYVSGLTFAGSSLKFFLENSLATEKDEEGTVSIPSYGFPPGPDAPMQGTGNSGSLPDPVLEASMASAQTEPNDAMLTAMTAGANVSFQCSMLPPQVLVPLSMRKGDVFSQNINGLFLTRSSSDCHDRMSHMHSLHIHQREEVEQRVHGGNVIPLLIGQALSFGTQSGD